jgi:hypothetical protein
MESEFMLAAPDLITHNNRLAKSASASIKAESTKVAGWQPNPFADELFDPDCDIEKIG